MADHFALISKYPIAFSIVREDSNLDYQLVNHWAKANTNDKQQDAKVLMVASGGCTAALLASHPHIGRITLVDPNPYQLALSKLKIHLSFLPPSEKRKVMTEEQHEGGNHYIIIKTLCELLGLDFQKVCLTKQGKFESLFAMLQERLLKTVAKELSLLFHPDTTIAEQITLLNPSNPLGKALDSALDDLLSDDHLTQVFGADATRNPVQSFSRHFAEQLRLFATRHLFSQSPWMASMLLNDSGRRITFPWMNLPPFIPRMVIQYEELTMNQFCATNPSSQFDIAHLSNILDWLSIEEALQTLSLVFRCLTPKGLIIIRQLNSSLNIESLLIQTGFKIDYDLSKGFVETDRSAFYRNIWIGIKG